MSSSSSSSGAGITFEELVGSRPGQSGDRNTVELHYRCTGTSDDALVKTVAEGSTPSTYGTSPVLVRQTISRDPVWVDTDADDGEWRVTVRYGESEPIETGDSSYGFEVGGATEHITQSKQTVNSYAPAGETAPDQKGAIGVTDRGEVEGVDIVSPTFQFSETHYLADSTVDTAYKKTLSGIVGKVNTGTFKGHAAGEVLCLPIVGSKRGNDQWEITFRFAVSENKTGLTVGDITGITKSGWHYLWVLYEDDEDGAADSLVKVPKAAYVEKVYDTADFSGLGIGT